VNLINEIKIYMENSNDQVVKLNSNVKALQILIKYFSNIIEKPLQASDSLKIYEPVQDVISQKTAVSESLKDQNNVILLDSIEGSCFDLILSIEKSNSPALEIANTLEKIRKKLENENPLNPILFELSVESKRLKALGNIPLDEYNLKILMEKIKN
jgi:hypothetical protein